MSTNFAKEFRLYEHMNENREAKPRKALLEARSVADIEAEIEKLKQELAQAKIAEKKASYGGKLPVQVYIWDMYIDPSEQGSWKSAELWHGKLDGTVFETEDDAIDGAWTLLGELEDEGELEGDPDDYTIDVESVPVSSVHSETLAASGLAHLI